MTKTKKPEPPPKDIDMLVSVLTKNHGEGAVVYGEGPIVTVMDRISSGSSSLDIALGGGLAQGRIVEIFGPESSGKTTLGLHAVAEAQKKGLICAYIDVEHAVDGLYAEKLGVKMSKVLFSQPDNAEQALQIAETVIRSGLVGLVVIDSVAALVPRAEVEGEVGDQFIGIQARLMSQAMRKFASIVKKNNTCVVFMNQIRMKIGVMFGNPEVTSGGNALKFYASQRLDIRRIAQLKRGEDDIYGITSRVKVIKNKVGRPFKQVEIDIEFDKGINKMKDLIRQSVKQGVIEKAGAWYSFKGERLGQGETNTADFLEENEGIAQVIQEHLNQCTISS